MQIEQLLALKDNYVYLIHDEVTGETAVIDPSESKPVFDVLERKGWRLTQILNTHHHWDHVGGNLELKEKTGATVSGFLGDKARIPGIDSTISEGDIWKIGSLEAKVFEIPGHTTGHIAFYFEKNRSLFCGDTLFTLGCGRLFEGTPEQMWKSLARLRELPPETKVYCGHEYTALQTKFCLAFEPKNQELIKRTEKVLADTEKGIPTVPSTMEEELKTNPFLRPQSPEIRESLGLQKASDEDVFRELRLRKDQFH